MIYREAGQIKTSYVADQAIFPITQDRWFIGVILAIAFIVFPLVGNEYFLQAIMIPVLTYSLAAIGLNILTGYCGQVSLGTGGFMAVGAVSCYKLMTGFPELNLIVVLLLSGFVTAAVGMIFGIPSLRIKGFYLAVATLAAQFFVEWVFGTFSWFTGGSMSMVLDTPPMTILGYRIESTLDHYYLTLGFVIVMTLFAKNLVRSGTGRAWMAIRDMDVAAEVIGIDPLKTKLSAFAVSSFYAGVAGALFAFAYVKSVDFTAFDLFVSFKVLFMIIIGGLGSILGSFLGAGFIVLLPILINIGGHELAGGRVSVEILANTENMIFGGLIIFFLIIEPYGLARLWTTAKEKLRLWPFPY